MNLSSTQFHSQYKASTGVFSLQYCLDICVALCLSNFSSYRNLEVQQIKVYSQFLAVNMKSIAIFLTLGVVSVIAVPTQTTTNTPLSNDSAAKQNEKTENNVVSEQNKVPSDLDSTTKSVNYLDGSVDIVFEGTFNPVTQDNYQINDFVLEENGNPINDFMPEDDSIRRVPDSPLIDNLVRNVMLNKVNDEIMETAEGFIPVPLPFRKRSQARRRFSQRRQYKRTNPHYRRRPYFYYPRYGYYYPGRRYY